MSLVDVVTTVVIGIPAGAGSNAVTAVSAITRAMVDHDIKVKEDFDAACARANYYLMNTLV